ncbi:hypothetical protein AYI70_g7566, partial [Smittium culicis]
MQSITNPQNTQTSGISDTSSS